MRPVDVLGVNVEVPNGAPFVLLREHDAPNRVLPISVGAPEALAIGLALSNTSPPRPLTHDLVVALLDHLHAHVDHVEVTALLDGTFHAELALQGPAGERRIDSRPSDAIALALRVDAPVFASEDVLDEAGTIPSVVTDADAVDEEAIEAEVARFRTLLDDLEPDQLADGDPDDPPDASQG
jgi:uncharacterized protein